MMKTTTYDTAPAMLPVADLFALLPTGIRERAMANWRNAGQTIRYEASLSNALGLAFSWAVTPERYNWWDQVWKAAYDPRRYTFPAEPLVRMARDTGCIQAARAAFNASPVPAGISA